VRVRGTVPGSTYRGPDPAAEKSALFSPARQAWPHEGAWDCGGGGNDEMLQSIGSARAVARIAVSLLPRRTG
jgi:hypothetical protein